MIMLNMLAGTQPAKGKNMQKQAKAVIFDFNGTMIFDSPIHEAVWMDFIPAHGGAPLGPGEYDTRISGRTNDRILTDFFGPMSREEIDRLAYEKEAEYRRRCALDKEAFRLADGLPEFLDALKAAGIPMNIATGSECNNVNFYFQAPQLGLSRWFDREKIVYDDGTLRGKPDPDSYLRAARKLGVDCRDCVIFEDSFAGVEAAHRAGAACVIALGTADRERFDRVGGVDLAVPDYTGWRAFPGLSL